MCRDQTWFDSSDTVVSIWHKTMNSVSKSSRREKEIQQHSELRTLSTVAKFHLSLSLNEKFETAGRNLTLITKYAMKRDKG